MFTSVEQMICFVTWWSQWDTCNLGSGNEATAPELGVTTAVQDFLTGQTIIMFVICKAVYVSLSFGFITQNAMRTATYVIRTEPVNVMPASVRTTTSTQQLTSCAVSTLVQLLQSVENKLVIICIRIYQFSFKCKIVNGCAFPSDAERKWTIVSSFANNVQAHKTRPMHVDITHIHIIDTHIHIHMRAHTLARV